MTTQSKFIRRDPAEVEPWAETCGEIRCLIEESDGAAGEEVHDVEIEDAKLHYHERTDEFYYVIDGQGTMILDENEIELHTGVVVYVPRGADVNARLKKGKSGRGHLNRTGATPFLPAAKTADVPLMRLLVESGADPRLPNADNCTPLMAAAGVGTLAPGEEAGTEPEAVKLALKLGADVNAVDDNGETAMHGAAYKSLPLVVQLLAQRGAKIEVWNRKNKYGWTPLRIAQGHRPGNFKPSAETIAALQQVMRAARVTPKKPANTH